MRRIIALLAAVMMLLGVMAGCTVKTGETDERPYVVCTIFPQYDFVKNIVGSTMNLELLVPAGTETHAFAVKDLSAAHLDKLLDADLLVSVGGESDEKLMEELHKFYEGKNTNVKFVEIVELVSEKLEESETMGMHVEEEAGEGEGEEHEHEEGKEEEFDEHVWTSPKRAVEIVNGLVPYLTALLPENAETYKANAKAYVEKLEALDAKFEEVVSKKTVDTLIFADRFPFRYLCCDYKLSADAAFQGCSTSIEPAAATLDYLYNKAAELKLPAIMYMEGSKPTYAEKLAKDLGVRALLLHSCHVISQDDFDNKDYISIMEQNVETLKIALGVK